MKKAPAKKKAPKVIKNDVFTLTLTIAGLCFVGRGTTVLEALLALPKPVKIMLKGVLTLTQGDKKKVLFLQPARIKRLFMPLARFQVSKELLVGFK